MAQLSITVPDGQVARIVSAFEVTYGPKGALTNAQFMSACIKTYVKSIVRSVETTTAAEAAAQNAAPTLDTDIP